MFRVAPCLDLKKLEAIFRHKVFRMLLAKGRITKDLIAMLSNWRHSGFQVPAVSVYFPRIRKPWKTWLVHHAGFLLQRTDAESRRTLEGYLPGKGWDGRKRIDVLEWLSAICSHIPDCREQMVRY